MKKQALFYVFALLMSCTSVQKKQNETLHANDNNIVDEQNKRWKALNAYAGKYSRDTGFFENDLVKTQLKKILNDDYEEYMKFVGSANYYGIIEKLDNIIYTEVSLMHVSGCNSLVFINANEPEVYLFWLKGSVRKKDYQIYGKLPIPETVKKIIVDDMNSGWGHIAEFVYKKNDSLLINLKSN